MKDLKLKDFRVDNDGDLLFNDGDMDLIVSSDENARAIIYSNPGDWAQHPSLGVGIENYLNGELYQQILRDVVDAQLTMDGFVLDDFEVSGSNKKDYSLYIKARRIL